MTEADVACRFDEEAQRFEDRLNDCGWPMKWKVLRYVEVLNNRDGVDPRYDLIVRSRLTGTNVQGKTIFSRDALSSLSDGWLRGWTGKRIQAFRRVSDWTQA